MTKAEMIRYLSMMRDVCESNLDGTERRYWHYAGTADFLLRHASWFAAPRKSCQWLGLPKACFANARAAALAFGWKYVEGEANAIIPVHHAWCVDERGKVQ